MAYCRGQAGKLFTSFDDLGAELEWRIGDFWSLSHDDGDYYNSAATAIDGRDWWLEIYPNGYSSADSLGHVDIFLCRQASKKPVSVNMSVSLITVNREKSGEWHAIKVFEGISSCLHAFHRILSRLELRDRASELMPSGILTVALTLEWTTPAGSMSSPRGPQKSKALQDYKQMFLKQENCDVVLKVGGREFPAHKNILAARSPVLASAFQHNMKEKKTGTVDIEDCDSSSFSDFLCYLYCEDASSLSQENVFSLFKAADKYDVPDLRMKCLEFMKENLSVDSFCDTITLALLHTETELIHAASEFFVKNAEYIVVTAEWQTFICENPIQGNELFVKFIKFL